ncbi:hypothetical protein D3C87_947790 [compost metagenome]
MPKHVIRVLGAAGPRYFMKTTEKNARSSTHWTADLAKARRFDEVDDAAIFKRRLGGRGAMSIITLGQARKEHRA